MSLARTRATQGLRIGLRQCARPAVSSTGFSRTQLVAKRYASSGHEQKSSSDLPWLISALVITPTSCWYLWPSAHDDDHHEEQEHDDHKGIQFEDRGDNKFEKEKSKLYEEADESNHEIDEEAAGGKDDDEEQEGGEDEKSDDKPEGDSKDEKSDDKAEGDSKDEKNDDKSDDSDDGAEQKGKGGDSSVEGVNFKGKMKEDSDGQEHNVKVESDSKGEKKRRLDSGLQKNLGPPSAGDEGDNSTAAKQDGLSNTQTRHSIPIHESDEKSKKPDGTPETAKTVGTVDPGKTQ